MRAVPGEAGDVIPSTRTAIAVLIAGLALAATAGGCAPRGDQRVQFTATDGVQLVGYLQGVSGPGIVFAHSYRTDQRRWREFADETAGAGFRTLTFDFRGYGESEGQRDVATIDRDVEGAYRYLVGRKIRPVFLVGASMGGTAVVLVAARVPVAGVATLSAPIVLGGLDLDPSLPLLRAPKLFIAAEGDATAAAAVQRFVERTPDPKTVRMLPGDAHGMDLFASPAAPAVKAALRAFFAGSS